MKHTTQFDSENSMLDNIMENFDFKKCRRAMQAVGWEYYGIPTITESVLKELALQRLKDCIKYCKSNKTVSHRSPFFVESGGFKATAWKNNYGHITNLQLEFVLTDWEHDADY